MRLPEARHVFSRIFRGFTGFRLYYIFGFFFRPRRSARNFETLGYRSYFHKTTSLLMQNTGLASGKMSSWNEAVSKAYAWLDGMMVRWMWFGVPARLFGCTFYIVCGLPEPTCCNISNAYESYVLCPIGWYVLSLLSISRTSWVGVPNQLLFMSFLVMF